MSDFVAAKKGCRLIVASPYADIFMLLPFFLWAARLDGPRDPRADRQINQTELPKDQQERMMSLMGKLAT